MVFPNALHTFKALLSNGEELSLSAANEKQARLLLESLIRPFSIVSITKLSSF